MANFLTKLVSAVVPREITNLISNAVPNEIKNVVSNIIPNEIKKYIDPNNMLNANLNEKPKAPAPVGVGVNGAAPTYDQTMLDAFNSQYAIQNKLIAGMREFEPQYLDIQKDAQNITARNQMDLMAELYPRAGTIEAAYQNQLRGNELQQLQSTLPQYQQAIQSLTPGYAQAIASTGQLAQQSMQRANVAPQLTSFEQQVGTPYGPSAQMQQQPQLQPQQAYQQQPQQAMQPSSQGPAGNYSAQMQQAMQQQMQAYQQQMQQSVTAMPQQQPGMAQQGQTMQIEQGGARQGGGLIQLQDTTPRYQQLGQQLQQFRARGEEAPPELVSAIRQEEQAMTASRQGPAMPASQQAYQQQMQQAMQQQMQAQQSAPQGQAFVPGATQGPLTAQQAIQRQQQASPMSPSQQMQAGMGQQGQGQQPQGPPQYQQNTSPPGTPPPLQNAYAGQYANQVQQFQPSNIAAMAGTPQEVGYLNTVGNAQQTAALAGNVPGMENLNATQNAASAAAQAGAVPTARNLAAVRGPQLASNLQNINQGTVNQYLSAMPGMQDYARMLAQQSQSELSAGRSLTSEEQRMADQSARSAYAARGTALGNQAINAEILNRSDVSNQRYQQRLQNASQAANTIQNIYQPALAQSLERQQGGLQYGLDAQRQTFGQAQDRDVLNQQLQAQKYSQAMGTQAAGFGQAQTKDTMAAQLQKQRYDQLMGAQGTAFEQAGTREDVAQKIQQQRYTQSLGNENYLQGAQQQNYTQAMGREALLSGTQAGAFSQALQRGTAEQQRLQAGTTIQAGQAQLGAGALGQLQTAQGSVFNAYNKQPLLQQTVGQAQTMGLANQQAAGNSLFQPESPLAFQSAFLPFNSNIALQQSQMQADAARSAGNSSMTGNLVGAGIGAIAMVF